jgi:hypothetical protein
VAAGRGGATGAILASLLTLQRPLCLHHCCAVGLQLRSVALRLRQVPGQALQAAGLEVAGAHAQLLAGLVVGRCVCVGGGGVGVAEMD